jgi:S-adenosylmethionine synthetase
MGFLKDVRRTMKASAEASKNRDVKATLAEAQRQMAAATASMQAAAGTGDLSETGERATAQVLAVRATSMMVNYSPMLEVDLMVFRDGHPPYPATATRSSTSGIPAAGQEVAVLVDPEDPARVVMP